MSAETANAWSGSQYVVVVAPSCVSLSGPARRRPRGQDREPLSVRGLRCGSHQCRPVGREGHHPSPRFHLRPTDSCRRKSLPCGTGAIAVHWAPAGGLPLETTLPRSQATGRDTRHGHAQRPECLHFSPRPRARSPRWGACVSVQGEAATPRYTRGVQMASLRTEGCFPITTTAALPSGSLESRLAGRRAPSCGARRSHRARRQQDRRDGVCCQVGPPV